MERFCKLTLYSTSCTQDSFLGRCVLESQKVFGKILRKKTNARMEYQTKFICETFSWMGVTFRDESNEPSSTMIGYSDATITAPNHPLIIRSKDSLGILTATVP